MKILYQVTCANEITLIESAIANVMESDKHTIVLKLDLISDRLEGFLKCKTLSDRYDGIFNVHRENNQSARINDALIMGFDRLGFDAVINGSPDVHFETPDDFNFFIDHAEKVIDNKFMIGNKTCPEDDVWSSFILTTPLGWDKIGCWDENIFFQANENDWITRANHLTGNNDWLETVITNSHHIGKSFCTKEEYIPEDRHKNLEILQTAAAASTVYMLLKWNSLFNTPNLAVNLPADAKKKIYKKKWKS